MPAPCTSLTRCGRPADAPRRAPVAVRASGAFDPLLAVVLFYLALFVCWCAYKALECISSQVSAVKARLNHVATTVNRLARAAEAPSVVHELASKADVDWLAAKLDELAAARAAPAAATEKQVEQTARLTAALTTALAAALPAALAARDNALLVRRPPACCSSAGGLLHTRVSWPRVLAAGLGDCTVRGARGALMATAALLHPMQAPAPRAHSAPGAESGASA